MLRGSQIREALTSRRQLRRSRRNRKTRYRKRGFLLRKRPDGDYQRKAGQICQLGAVEIIVGWKPCTMGCPGWALVALTAGLHPVCRGLTIFSLG
ncbi:MAG: hypothetical protein F6K10_12015 [Moorea sp. SIO2B7]|nr:hypothetical protein [Moorena sp. SIO2B7]